MSRLNPEDYEGYEVEFEGKAKNFKHIKSRKRNYAVDNLAEQLKKYAEKKRAKEAEESIKKQLGHFPDIDTYEGKEQAKIYSRWVLDSLKERQPILSEGDVRYTYTLSTRHAGGQNQQKNETHVTAIHIPTYLEAKNSSERKRPTNQIRAYQSLYPKLEAHLSLWQDLLIPEGNNINLVESRVHQFLDEINTQKNKPE